MKITLPDINKIILKVSRIESAFGGETKSINSWVEEHRKCIKNNQRLVKKQSEKNDIKILLSILRDMLVRAMTGEKGELVHTELSKVIKKKSDLNSKNYRKALNAAKYRWGAENGCEVIENIVIFFDRKLNWKWNKYFNEADKNRYSNFVDDDLLKIKNIGFKLRDLTLSSFNQHYAAFDTHVTRVPTRIGLLNYGFELLNDQNFEMGNDPSNEKNYLFLHRLFIKLSQMTDEKYSVADLDRIFWHFGKTMCSSKPKCNKCSIATDCLTGKYRV
jgi:hypothetical protein